MTELYKNIDYRGFVFVIHNQYGMLLLHCTRKPKKGPHYQLPGGHIDDFEFEHAIEKHGNNPSSFNKVLLEAAKMGTARELYEETGIDIRSQLHRLEPVQLQSQSQTRSMDNPSGVGLVNMLQNKIYFFLNVSDDDFLTVGDGLMHPHGGENGKHLALRISHEHSGFMFENDPLQSIEKIAKHSGGTGARALRMSMHMGSETKRDNTSGKSSLMDTPLEGPSRSSVEDSVGEKNRGVGQQGSKEKRVVGQNAPKPILLPPLPKKHGSESIFSCCMKNCC